jgi:GNAT superfamily N-acetyltransferase
MVPWPDPDLEPANSLVSCFAPNSIDGRGRSSPAIAPMWALYSDNCGAVSHYIGLSEEASQSSGIADRWLTHAESHFRERNRKRISLDTTATLTRAIRFYKRHGFVSSGKVQDFFGIPSWNA